jgi:trimethylamine--corrinoid protein Co-methyltransferase
MERANLRWKQVMDEYQPPDFDPAIDEALKSFICQRKAETKDMWH